MFLEKSPELLTRRSRLEHLLLLLLRCLAIALLALAFSRPFLRTEMPAVEVTGAARLLMLDTSASMRRAGLWEKAVEEAKAAIAKSGDGDLLALMTFDRQPSLKMSFEDWRSLPVEQRKERARQIVDGLKPGWASSDGGAALIQAAGIMDEVVSAGEQEGSRDRQIIVVSDFQEGLNLDALAGFAWPQDLAVEPRLLQPKDLDNFGLALVAAQADDEADEFEEEAASVSAGESELPGENIQVRVRNTRDSAVERFSLYWKDEPARGLKGGINPGASRILTAPPRTDPTKDGVLVMDGDSEDFDNLAYVTRLQPRPVRVLYHGEKVSETDTSSAFFYFSRAMQPTDTFEPTVSVHKKGTPAELQDIDFVVATASFAEAQLPALTRWVENGGTLLYAMREGDTGESLQGLTGLTGLKGSEAQVTEYAMLADLDFEHPLLLSFAKARVRDFTKVHFWKHRSLSWPETEDGKVVRVANFDDGQPAWLEVPRGKGKVLVFASSWAPSDSQLALSTKFVPLLYSAFRLAGYSASRPPLYYVGDVLQLPPGVASVTLPGGESRKVPAAGGSFAETSEPGIYTADTGTRVYSYAVNVAPSESRVSPMEMERLNELGVVLAATADGATGGAVAGESPEDTQRKQADRELEQHQRMWWWLLLAAGAILLVETWLAGRARRARPAADTSATVTAG